ncbi:MAG TPA: secondary thiamine-phosphate synthase enzyme YjbQ [Rectinemataceae bacterium]|nr:secondary thiamine-phosphate synthase enzyme YjbQ [Rectinemataceae bacterium]
MKTSFTFEITTKSRSQLLAVTEQLREATRQSGVDEGFCVVYVPHTTAGVFINENADPDVAFDVLSYFDRLVPRSLAFRHAEGNSDAHIKAILAGSSVSIPIIKGEPALRIWQGVFFAEFDGPRTRRFTVTCVASGG